jgi:hypothetical protein
MPAWFSKNLGNGMVAYTPTREIMNAFTPLFTAAGLPVEMAVFSGNDQQGNVIVYFSPSASDLAKMFGAQPSEKPPREGLSLLVGDARAWEYFYPTSQGNQ